jgi:hypothetical protein
MMNALNGVVDLSFCYLQESECFPLSQEKPIDFLIADLVAKVDTCTVTKLAKEVVSQISCKLTPDMLKIEELSKNALNAYNRYKDMPISGVAFQLMNHLDVLKKGTQDQASDQFHLIYQGLIQFGDWKLWNVDGKKLSNEVLKQAALPDSKLTSMGWKIDYPLNRLLEQVMRFSTINSNCNGTVESLENTVADSSQAWNMGPVLAFGLAFAVSFAAAKVFSHYRSKGQPV